MPVITFATHTTARRERVWEVITGDATYREWTKPFAEGSCFVGDWSEGSEMRFLMSDEAGADGMIVQVQESSFPFRLVLAHVGIVSIGQEVRNGPDVDPWKGSLETYTISREGDRTKLEVSQDVPAEHEASMREMWGHAFARLKELAEEA